MIDSPVVLLLVKNIEEREAIRRRLIELEAIPIAVRADRAMRAIVDYQPISAVMDEPHAAMAPDDFFLSTSKNHVRLVTLPHDGRGGAITDSLLRGAAAYRMSEAR